MTLYLWKGPVIDDSDEAARLIEQWDERGDASAFEPSPEIAKVADELIRRFPYGEKSPWADGPPEATDRILYMTIRWGADNAALDAIEELARQHGLVLYDPQGPNVGVPEDPSSVEESPPMRTRDYVWFFSLLIPAGGIFWLGWWIDVPVLNWILRIVGGFFLAVVLFLLKILVFEPRGDDGKPNPRTS